jgi:2-phospho-L-lactate guanylyltransferase (CobY/MobA/RfbA family)
MTPATVELLAFGSRSLDRHIRRARELGYAVQSHVCARLALDLDLPEDYRQLEKLSAVPPLRTPASALSKGRAVAGRRGRAASAFAR